ncbi:MAG: nitroreductase/quinone reductase family protein [Actinomycetota bacterium]
MTQPSRRFLRIVWRLHRFWYRVSGGRIGAKMSGLPMLELTTTGRTTGQARSVLLTYLRDPRGYIVIASNAGSANDPAWWRNLQSHPSATVRTGRIVRDVRMRPLDGDERADSLDRAIAAYPGYATYAKTAGRTIPVALLEVERGTAG